MDGSGGKAQYADRNILWGMPGRREDIIKDVDVYSQEQAKIVDVGPMGGVFVVSGSEPLELDMYGMWQMFWKESRNEEAYGKGEWQNSKEYNGSITQDTN